MVDESGQASGEDLTLEPVVAGTKTRPRALWGVLAAVALAAGALAVTSGGGDGPPQLPVAFGASAGREAAASAMSADMALAWVTYLAGDGLPALGGDAPAYRVASSMDEARVRALADALGITGDPTHDGSLWRVESDGAVLEVYEDGGGTWWYSASQYGDVAVGSGSAGCAEPGTECKSFAEVGTAMPATTVPPTCAADGPGCATVQTAIAECPPNAECIEPSPPVGEPCPPDAICTLPVPAEPVPPEPVPPVDLPSKDEARQIALDLLAATGLDLTDAKVTVDGPYDAWYVTVEPLIDGIPVSGWMFSAGVGSKGAITSASGTLGTPERLGDYPLIDTRAAIDRLNALQDDLSGGIVPMARDATATDSVTAGSEAPATTSLCEHAEPCSGIEDPGDSTTTMVTQCKVQPDGSEVCEGSTGSSGSASTVICVEPLPEPAPAPECPVDAGICREPLPPADDGFTDTTLASPECVDQRPYPEPEPIEIVLTDAERVLVLLPSLDGEGDTYLVPGYRFSSDDGAVVDVAAVSDESLAPTTTIPETTDPPGPPLTGCETLVEGDSAGTTHTVNPCQPPDEPLVLEDGATPELGIGYSVDVIAPCGQIADFGGRWWHTDHDLADLPSSSGTLVLTTADDGVFASESGYTVTLQAQGPAADYPGCG